MVKRLDINGVTDGKFLLINACADEFIGDNARCRIDFSLAEFISGLLNDLLTTFDARIIKLFFESGDNFFSLALGFANHGGGFFFSLTNDFTLSFGNFVAHFGDFLFVFNDLLLTFGYIGVFLFKNHALTFELGNNLFKIGMVGIYELFGAKN